MRKCHPLLMLLALMAVLSALVSCSSTKHVPQGQYLLDKVDIDIDGNTQNVPDKDDLRNFLRQRPNNKVLGFAKLRLGTYNLAGNDSTKWYNKMLYRLGQAPVIYREDLTAASARQLRLAMINSGFTHATVSADTCLHGRKVAVTYHIVPGRPHIVSAVGYNVPDTAIQRVIARRRNRSALRPGMLLNRTVLDEERSNITRQLRNAGYFDFNRDNVSFTADTVANSPNVELTLNVRPGKYRRYVVNSLTYFIDSGSGGSNADTLATDTVHYDGATFVYGGDRYLRPQLLDEMCYIKIGENYSARDVERTYEALGRLAILKFIDIRMVPAADDAGDVCLLNAHIYLSRTKKQTASVEVEGTNSEGDLGFGVGLTYQHRNLTKGSELLTVKLRANYENLSGDFEDLINKRYTELAAEVGITMPKFACPFLTKAYKQRQIATTELALTTNFQERPEYTRLIFGAAWRWKWQRQRQGYTRRHSYDLIDISYVKLPRSTINFIDEIAPTNPLLRYSYEDHFIMRMGYTFSRTNRRVAAAATSVRAPQPYVNSLRVSAEVAGNLLYALSSLTHQRRRDGVYKILGIQYAQYAKADFDFTYTRNFSWRHALAVHTGAGIAVPYGNSSMVPFEKRFYGGGANGVRGWGVRTLGPGAYDSRNSVTDFIYQCGDIRLDLSVEYRARLFWVLEGALFVDAGNIWTIRNYVTQPGGMFHFNTFYKQIAAAYGAGIRLNFTYFVIRLDLGMKAHNPARDQEPWPIVHPVWHRDATFHFSVGYPF